MVYASRKIVLGCRESSLAMAQANEVADALRKRVDKIDIEIATFKTGGDIRRDVSVDQIGVGVFVKEIEAALAAGEIDIAVHSLKDLPTTLTDGLVIASVPYREDPRDAVISKNDRGLNEINSGSIIATGSARRRALIAAERDDLILKPIRGNVTTRLAMLDEEDSVIDALVLAAAGLKRINMANRISEYLGCMSFVSAPGQGALAVQTRADDKVTRKICAAIEDRSTRICVDTERAFLAEIGGGCSAPIGAHAQINDNVVSLAVFVSEPSGANFVRYRASAPVDEGIEMGKRVAQHVIHQGALDYFTPSAAVAN